MEVKKEVGEEGEGDATLKYFTETGNCTDEIKLLFDDGQVLYVSENLLTYASPVFKAMFDHNFIEKKNREVKLAGKKYRDFHEFLLCLHPAVQRKISVGNVLRLAEIAEEYQVAILIMRCKNVMCSWLYSEVKGTNNTYGSNDNVRNSAANCLRILHKALEYRFEDVADKAITCVCKFGYGVFSGKLKLNTKLIDYWDPHGLNRTSREAYITDDDTVSKKSDCFDLFEELPADIRYKLLTERLKLCDSNDMTGVN